ncbi:MAG: DUF502 domain-containing protein [candidate division NC10 bacterium]|nr:DUF502 domain-containing protein [candidate division NC10 bacterium]
MARYDWYNSGDMAVSGVRRRVRELFVVGLAVVLPLLVTYLLLRFLFEALDGLLDPMIQGILGRRIPGLGFLATVAIIFLIGALTTNIIGRKLVAVTEDLLLHIPLVKNVYAASKQLFDAFTLPGRGAFRQVVMLEYPRSGLYALGFITATQAGGFQDLVGERTVNVFIPTAPNPTSGFFLVVPEKSVIPVPISVEEALKLIVSGGLIIPPALQARREG